MQSLEVTPYFSIVIPCYNRAGTMDRTIRSCLAQTFADFEIVIVDDGSRDAIEEVVSCYDDPRVKFFSQANAGGAAARNRGAELAHGRYIAFLDADDEFLPGKLEAFHGAIEAADARAEQTVWYSPLYFYRSESNRMIKPPRAIDAGEPVGDYLFCHDGMMQTSTLVIPRSLFMRVRFDPSLRNLQDLDLCMRLDEAGARFRMLPAPQVIWYDETDVNRISYSIKAEQIQAWAEMHRDRLTPKAYHGFLARYLVPAFIRTQPLEALRILWGAMTRGSLSGKRAATLLARGAMPATYQRMRDSLVARQRA
ncbi:glycosyltransferase family 2 protein [Hoeflea sp.]|uniref:glycosyltransferase family 2 protein n=1 Tax=Hoeflea sp. TaxID=1940281 RepID=UPI0019C2BBED|nr:glycosyltransferase family 2 protein [Hoeflea sp.]MBC7284755.1 glycosyltransferase family 2 protein [Hoeflea sp.]